MTKDLRVVVRQCRKAGFEVVQTRGNHLAFYAPDGEIIVGAFTPSDYRSMKNLMARLHRHGLPRQKSQRRRAAA